MPGPLSYKWDCSQRPLPQAQWALGVPKGIRSFLLQTCSSSWVPQLTGKHHPWANCPRPIMSLLTRLLLLSQPGTRIMATSCQLCLPVISGIGSFGPTPKSHCHVRSGQLLTRPLGIPSPPSQLNPALLLTLLFLVFMPLRMQFPPASMSFPLLQLPENTYSARHQA